MEYKINKAKLKDNCLEASWHTIIQQEGKAPIINDDSRKSDQLVHEDLKKAFDDLRKHLVIICDQKEDGSAIRILEVDGLAIAVNDYDKEAIEKYTVTGFVVGGEDRDGVTLIGQKRIESKVLNITSPFTKFEDYPYASDLAACVETCMDEVYLYLFEGKCAPDKQLDLFDQGFDTHGEGFEKVTMQVNDGEEVDVTKMVSNGGKSKKAVTKEDPEPKEEVSF